MATIRIHEDQENSVPNNPLRQKQSIMAQPKRSVLGVLDNRILPNTNGNAGKGKEVKAFSFVIRGRLSNSNEIPNSLSD